MITLTAPDTLGAMTLRNALSQAWLAIRKQVPDVPDATVGVGDGPAHVIDWDSAVVMVPPGTVAQGNVKILEFLLHQAAHSLAGEPRRTTGGRYHGNGYHDAALALGLAVEYTGTGKGWSETSLTADLAEIYADQLTQLRGAMSTWQPTTGPSRNGIVAQCPVHTDFKIRIRGADAASKLADHPVKCSRCDQELVPV
jgi:hypothetical protein